MGRHAVLRHFAGDVTPALIPHVTRLFTPVAEIFEWMRQPVADQHLTVKHPPGSQAAGEKP